MVFDLSYQIHTTIMQKVTSIRISRDPKSPLEKSLWGTPFWPVMRLFGSDRKHYDMRPKEMSLATLKAVSGQILELQIPNGKFDQNFIFLTGLKNPDRLARILATSILNDPRKSPLKIEKWLMKNLSTMEFSQAFLALRMNMPTDEFLEIISTVRTINILEEQNQEENGGELSGSDQARSGD